MAKAQPWVDRPGGRRLVCGAVWRAAAHERCSLAMAYLSATVPPPANLGRLDQSPMPLERYSKSASDSRELAMRRGAQSPAVNRFAYHIVLVVNRQCYQVIPIILHVRLREVPV